MSKKLYWGLGALALCIIGATVFFVLKDQAEIRELKRQLAEDMQGHYHSDGTYHHGQHDEHESSADVPRDDVREAKPGNVPKVSSDKVPKNETPKPQPKRLYTGPLTFHEELLKTNPVKALRLQQEERGHWSAEWIPPFPTDDTEAQEYAKAIYLFKYYHHTFGDLFGNPEYEKETRIYAKASEDMKRMMNTVMSYPYGARKYDLLKLTWPHVDKYVVSTSKGNVNNQPSEYFGNPETRRQYKALGIWKY